MSNEIKSLFLEIGKKIFIGSKLEEAIKNIYSALKDRRFPNIDESTNLTSAIIRRILYVSTIGILIAIIPSIFLIWQNFILEEQNSLINKQLVKMYLLKGQI